MRKAKIICTLGPAVDTQEMIEALMVNGMDAARFNFSHGTHDTHLAQLQKFRRAREKTGLQVATILDTKGPEIRIKTFASGRVMLEKGACFTLTTRNVPGTERCVSVTYDRLHEELQPGVHILVDDGLIELVVREIEGQDIRCEVCNGGELSGNKSMNIPDIKIALPALTDRDRSDLRFGVEQDFDYVAASFVRRASDVREIRAELDKWGGQAIKIIAKIENREGIENLEEIIDIADGIMVARGDLGVEVQPYEVPALQKRMIRETVSRGKPVITATQMLDSMIRNPRPTRAEVSDVANAVFDGTSCVMLSGETAAGKYPLQALETMKKCVEAAETTAERWSGYDYAESAGRGIADTISHASCLAAEDLHARAILTATHSGSTARMIARFRPDCDVIAFTVSEKVCRQLSMIWGVRAYLSTHVENTDEIIDMCVAGAKQHGHVRPGDIVVLTAGVPIGRPGTTNLIKVQTVE